MQEDSEDYTTFVCSRGLMRFKVMPFGMVNSGSTYNQMIRKLLVQPITFQESQMECFITALSLHGSIHKG